MNNPKRIALFGFPASGKSTFAKILNEKYNIPVYSLDLIRWKNVKNGEKDEEYFVKEYEKIINLDEWIIEGNALDYIDSRLEKSDILYFFDTGVEDCINNYIKREENVKNGEERLAFDTKMTSDNTIEWIKTRYAKKIEKLKIKLENYKDKLIIIHNYDELNNEIEKLNIKKY